ncbi:MAG: hypothetical protein H0U51_07730 [Propionibacteriales bacterium]|nr:hypothetical protein [Propionibacteriales bacterium]
MRVLFIGGTRFVGRAIAEAALTDWLLSPHRHQGVALRLDELTGPL